MDGSVTFCVVTAPAPASTCGQRLPTAMLEVVMATPAMPVRTQEPTIEKVIAPPYSSPTHSWRARYCANSWFPRPLCQLYLPVLHQERRRAGRPRACGQYQP